MNQLKQREKELLSITEEQRDEMDEDNPILFAETAPCRFKSISLWFTDDDGVEIIESIDADGQSEEISVVYFYGKEREAVRPDSPIYEWAVNYYDERWPG
jgi:hypothetical protein